VEFIFESDNLDDYLLCTDIIDFDNDDIVMIANELKVGVITKTELAQKTYEYVRDRISHSADISGKIVTCNASDVLNIKEGICYAKSHLLAALLRKNKIPCGFCYQLLRLNTDTSPLVLHGLNSVYLHEWNKWMRLDARGNKSNVNARFCIDKEQLAFFIHQEKGEIDYPYIFVNPDENAVSSLINSKDVNELWGKLPKCLSRTL
jgi:transglutaminase-like putative cysteine protease